MTGGALMRAASARFRWAALSIQPAAAAKAKAFARQLLVRYLCLNFGVYNPTSVAVRQHCLQVEALSTERGTERSGDGLLTDGFGGIITQEPRLRCASRS